MYAPFGIFVAPTRKPPLGFEPFDDSRVRCFTTLRLSLRAIRLFNNLQAVRSQSQNFVVATEDNHVHLRAQCPNDFRRLMA